MGLRDDVLWLFPALLIALCQVKIVWAQQPVFREEDTEIDGLYRDFDRSQFFYVMQSAYFIFLIQFVIPLLTISTTEFIVMLLRIIGYLFIVFGFCISISALMELGDNWTAMLQYRIKKGQELVTTGIYSIVRHPIYLAILLEVSGFELVANSWLWLVLFVISFIIIRNHIIKEDNLLELKYGNDFLIYKTRVKGLIPIMY